MAAMDGEVYAAGDSTDPPYGVRTRIERTGPAIRAALDEERRAEFETDFRAALSQADDTLDLAAVQVVLDRWWPLALLCANPEIQAGAEQDRRRVELGDPDVIVETWFPASHPHSSRIA